MSRKKTILTVSAAVMAVLAAALTVLFFVRKSRNSDMALIGGVTAPVTIERNALGVPSVRAENLNDAYFALGYLHAQDRYPLMEYFRAVTQGSSERILGKEGAPLDRLSISVGFNREALEMVKQLQSPWKDHLNAYVAGINTARKTLGLHDAIPRNWIPGDVLAILLMKEWGNAYLSNKELLFQINSSRKNPFFAELFPENTIHYYEDSEEKSVRLIRKINSLVRRHIGAFNRGYAFAYPGDPARETPNYLAFSYDHQLSQYPGIYPLHISIKDRKMKALTHAGMPFIFGGENDGFAFFGINLLTDIQDYIISYTRKGGESLQYYGRKGWTDFNSVRVPIELDSGQKKNMVVWHTESGPVLNDVFADGDYNEQVVALKFFFPGIDYVVSLFELPFSQSPEIAAASLKGIRSYPRACVFSSGTTLIRAYSGTIPVRPLQMSVFKPGGDFDWSGTRDIHAVLPNSTSPAVIASFSAEDAPKDVADILSSEVLRYSRLVEMIKSRSFITPQWIETILHDRYSLYAEKSIPLLIPLLSDTLMTSARLTRVYFQNWRYSMEEDQVAPAIFHLLMQQFVYETLNDELGQDMKFVMPGYRVLLPGFLAMLAKNDSPLFDDKSTFPVEKRDDIFLRSFLNSMRILNRSKGPLMDEWKWGSVHDGEFSAPFAGTDMFREIKGTRPLDGDFHTLFLGMMRQNLKPTVVTALAGYFGTYESSIYMYYGQSMDPSSPFYMEKQKVLGMSGFHELYSEYRTRITPLKSSPAPERK